MPPFRKSGAHVPAGYFRWEAAGLRWLAEVGNGVPVVTVLDIGADFLDLEPLRSVGATRSAAADFGERLALTHRAGAAAFGAPPPGWQGDGFFGPLSQPLPMALHPHPSWGRFVAEHRLRPITRRAHDAGALSPTQAHLLDQVADRCAAGDFDTDDPPARVHGDLWSGNVIWTDRGAILIDPAAHGGHRETDLAMLALFGAPHLEVTLAAYQGVWPLAPGWRERVALHQLYPLAVHALLFGGGYAAHTAAAARRYA